MSRLVREFTDIERMMQLGARAVLIKTFFTHADAKIQQIKRGLEYDFKFSKIAAVRVTGWANTRDGALSLNLIHRSFRKLYPSFDLDNESITAEMLIRLTVFHNTIYNEFEPVDINRIYSVFYGISQKEITPHLCSCGRGHIRVEDPESDVCPWCRFKISNSFVKSCKKVNSFEPLHLKVSNFERQRIAV